MEGQKTEAISLEECQGRLEVHFASLHSQRSKSDHWPIFALEHPFSIEEVNEIGKQLSPDLIRNGLSDKIWLAWVIWASEIGYEYDGHEYWQSFEERTPNWPRYGDPRWLREKFKQFQKEYGGAQPLGPWAEYFKNICWPINHAIVPKVLQIQFAQCLYDLRYSFSADILKSPIRLGEEIATYSWRRTRRFQEFAENVELVGQIAAALLFQGEEISEVLLQPETLRRIVQDLENVHSAKEWLRRARKSAEIVKPSGILRSSGSVRLPQSIEHAKHEIRILALQPNLQLRPFKENEWELQIELPDFSVLVQRFPEFRYHLNNSRCSLAGTEGWKPSGWLLYRPAPVVLLRFPLTDESLISFENAPPKELQFFLKMECLLPTGPVWLFRLNSDGWGIELKGKTVRSGVTYVILRREPLIQNEFSYPVQVHCEQIYAELIQVPEPIPLLLEQYLIANGLSVEKHVAAWPVGVAPSRWDGEGRGEWLTSDQPCLAFQIDHSTEGVQLVLDGDLGKKLLVSADQLGTAFFVQLPKLTPGSHLLEISKQVSGDEWDEIGKIELIARDPHPWQTSISAQNAMVCIMDPPHPTIEQLINGNVDIQISGPELRHFCIRISNSEMLFERTIEGLRFPIGPDKISQKLTQFFRTESVQEALDAARTVQVLFDGGELGSFSFTCEREIKPRRWTVRRDKNQYLIKFFDDSSSVESALYYHDFNFPDVRRSISEPNEWILTDTSGGLYIAIHDGTFTGIVLPRSSDMKSLRDFMLSTEFRHYERNPEQIKNLIVLSEKWGNAVTRNFWAKLQQVQTLKAIIIKILSTLCGNKWAKAERVSRVSAAPEILIDALSADSQDKYWLNSVYRAMINSSVKDVSTLIRVLAVTLTSVLGSRRKELELPCINSLHRGVPWYLEFALRIASCPHSIRQWAGAWFNYGVIQMLSFPEIIKAARFAVVLLSRFNDNQQPSKVSSVYPGMDWS